ncbi:MAG TPA: hypothetical protein VGP85_19500 [Pyrinomonadaceae bacterium]|nr:hypothetical protein [Pyrinomonadaceae bacterium]
MLSTLRVSPATGYIKASILACVRCYYRCPPATRFRRTGMATLNTSRLYQGSSGVGEKFGDSEGSAMPSVFFSPRKTDTMKRVVVQQYLGYQVVVGGYIMRGCRVRPSALFVSY